MQLAYLLVMLNDVFNKTHGFAAEQDVSYEMLLVQRTIDRRKSLNTPASQLRNCCSELR